MYARIVPLSSPWTPVEAVVEKRFSVTCSPA
jgi:hypothetical protein